MPKALTVLQIQKLEERAIQTIGIPSLVLMENAGRAVAVSVLKYLRGKKRAVVVIVCGPGNNGGDGMVAARHLAMAGIKVNILTIGSITHLKPDPMVFYKTLKHVGVRSSVLTKIDPHVLHSIDTADVLIDAIFGIGLNRPVQGLYKELIECINKRAKRTWSVDIPSGLDGTSGQILGVAVRAFKTVSFTSLKTGFLKNAGLYSVGRVEIADIGIPSYQTR